MLSTKLISFVAQQIGHEYTQNISSATLLQDDLHVYGDDAVEFMIAFGKEFNVDISQFNISSYFSPEGDLFLPSILRKILGLKAPERRPFTMQHLQDAIEKGKLV